MSNTVCPHCEKETITPMQRIKAFHWIDIYCSECGGRSAMVPIVMILLYFALVWNFLFFGFVAVAEKSFIYGAALFIGWFLLEFFGYYIPLVRLRPKQTIQKPNG